jgi:hypothetical protein
MEDQMKCGVFTFGGPINASVDLLGQTFASNVNGFQCQIHMPVSGDDQTLCGPSLHRWPIAAKYWGSTESLSGKLIISAFGISVDDSSTETDMLAISSDIDTWSRIFIEWVSMCTGRLVRPMSNHGPRVAWGLPSDRHWSLTRVTAASSLAAPSADTIRLAIVRAGELEELPVAHSLLLFALRALRDRNWRMTVVESATAVESALQTGIRQRLEDESSHEVIDALLERSRMLGGLIKLAADLDMSVPSNLVGDIIQPRNRVIHRGSRSSAEEARRAIDLAKIIVSDYAPPLSGN